MIVMRKRQSLNGHYLLILMADNYSYDYNVLKRTALNNIPILFSHQFSLPPTSTFNTSACSNCKYLGMEI